MTPPKMFGMFAVLMWIATVIPSPARADTPLAIPTTRPVAAVVGGYPAPDLPLYAFALKQRNVLVETFDQVWLPTDRYSRYSTVVVTGGIARAQMEPKQFKADDLPKLQHFMESGGTLIISRGGGQAFSSPEAGAYFQGLIGGARQGRGERRPEMKLLAPDHPWIKPLAQMKDVSWLLAASEPLRMTKGEFLIGSQGGDVILSRLRVGRGQIIYVGWAFSQFIPAGRNLNSTVEDEEKYEAQFKILLSIAAELYPAAAASRP